MIGYWNGYDTCGNMGGNWGLFGLLFMVIFWILIIALAILFIKRFHQGGSTLSSSSHTSALGLLKERYAKGEIDTKEYEERRNVLLHK